LDVSRRPLSLPSLKDFQSICGNSAPSVTYKTISTLPRLSGLNFWPITPAWFSRWLQCPRQKLLRHSSKILKLVRSDKKQAGLLLILLLRTLLMLVWLLSSNSLHFTILRFLIQIKLHNWPHQLIWSITKTLIDASQNCQHRLLAAQRARSFIFSETLREVYFLWNVARSLFSLKRCEKFIFCETLREVYFLWNVGRSLFSLKRWEKFIFCETLREVYFLWNAARSLFSLKRSEKFIFSETLREVYFLWNVGRSLFSLKRWEKFIFSETLR
jgi:hypothetical protein